MGRHHKEVALMNRSRFRSSVLFLLLASALLLVACGSSDGLPPSDVDADQVEIVRGVPDRGRNPAVVAIDIAGIGLCTGALVVPRVVLTARHCVSSTTEQVECPSSRPQVTADRAPSSLKILVGDDTLTASVEAAGREALTPSGDSLCGE